MTSDLRDQLQTALGSTYALQRELGGGGMSRVFLPHDPALDRDAKGEREKAASYYSRFIDLWKDADPELQPKVAEVKRRLASLRPAG